MSCLKNRTIAGSIELNAASYTPPFPTKTEDNHSHAGSFHGVYHWNTCLGLRLRSMLVGYIDFGDSIQLVRYSRVSYTVSQLNLLYHRDALPELL